MENKTILKKRIFNEIKYIEKNLPQYIITELNILNNITYIQIITPKHNKLIFELSCDYPFKPPSYVKCNNKDYHYSLKKMPKTIEYLYYNKDDMYYQENKKITLLNKTHCICCDSLLCADNWSPSSTIYDILNEISTHNKLKNKIMNKLILKNIFDVFNLPLELIRNVYHFL